MEAWQKPGEVKTQAWPQGSANTCLQAGAALGGSGTRLQPGTEPDPGTRMLQTFMDRNSATAVSVSWLRLASKSQKVAMNPTASLQQCPRSPRQLPGLTCSHFPWVLGSWLTQPLDTASSPSRKLPLELPVCGGTPSSGVLALMLPEMFLSSWVKSIHLPYFKSKVTYPSSPSP